MELINAAAEVSCDVLFQGASISNLLAALALMERFENIKLYILEDALETATISKPFITAISPDGWRRLMDVRPHLCNMIHTQKLLINEEGDDEETRLIVTDRLYAFLISQLPQNAIQPMSITSFSETTDFVTIQTQNGIVYKAKLLVTKGNIIEDDSDSVQVAFTASSNKIDARNKWNDSDVYVERCKLSNDFDVFSCLMHVQDFSEESVRRRIGSLLSSEGVLEDIEFESLYIQRLSKFDSDVSHGRTGLTGTLSSHVPTFLSLKLDNEIEEVLLLKRVIEQKGLTAAALSEWKRGRNSTPSAQVLRSIRSFFDSSASESNHRDPVSTLYLNDGECNSVDTIKRSVSELGKPLICRNVKPYVALTIGD